MNLFRNQCGFTTVEIIIVVALVAILAAVVGINIISELPNWRLKGAARQVMSDLMAARMQAVSQNNEFKVFFLDNHQYRILDDDDNDGTADDSEAKEDKDIQTEYHDVTFSSTNDPIFHPGGTASNLATITLTGGNGSNKYVKVAITGRVKIDDTL